MGTAGREPSLHDALRSWWDERVPRLGLRRTAMALSRELWLFVRDSTPERRRRRYGDMEYDWEHRVDTTSATVSLRSRLLGVFHSPYQPTEPELFREMLEGLGIDYERYTFIDLGSGKGRTLLMAMEYPFEKVVGVELLPELHRVAEENVNKIPGELKKCGALEMICGDATGFEFPAQPTVLYLFNPFPETGLERVVTRLGESLVRFPRELWVIYHNPLLESLVGACPGLEKVGGTAQYAVFASEKARTRNGAAPE
jgi:SAM-dependent methyltransferase